MLTWSVVVVVALANFRVGRSIAMWFRPRLPAAKPERSPNALLAFVIVGGAIVFFVWNRQTRPLPFSYVHAAVIGMAGMLGYQTIEQRQRLLQGDINGLARGVVQAFAQSVDDEERLDALITVAREDDLLSHKLDAGLLTARSSVDRSSPRLSNSDKVDVLLQEIGFLILVKFGEDVMPKAMKDALSPEAVRQLSESNVRTQALLDASAIDWEAVNEAVYRVSEARLRRGVPPNELTSLEQRIRARRGTEPPAA
jgi:hypothetical protein